MTHGNKREVLFVGAGILAFAIMFVRKLKVNFDADVLQLLRASQDPAAMHIVSESYSFWWNSALPVGIMALAVFAAWYTFHFLVMGEEARLLHHRVSYVFLSLFLLFLGYYLHQKLRIYWRIGDLAPHIPEPIHFYQRTRTLGLVAYCLVYFGLIAFYEIVYQLANLVFTTFGIDTKGASAAMGTLWVFGMGALGNITIGPGVFNLLVSVVVINVALAIGQATWFWFSVHKKPLTAGFLSVFSLALAGVLGIKLLSLAFLYPSQPVMEYLLGQKRELLAWSVFLALAAVGIGAWRYQLYNQRRDLEVQVSVKGAELDQLRAQVNPHFLFNALNTIYAIALRENAEQTASATQKLGDMMRFMLRENQQDLIPLAREVAHLEDYIAIQRMRLDERHDIQIDVSLQIPSQEVMIAPMLLNPFVENAFKHGISFQTPSWIQILLTFNEKEIIFRVHNSLPPTREDTPEVNSNGIGLDNVRRRLELIYPGKHTLHVQQSVQDFFISLTLTY